MMRRLTAIFFLTVTILCALYVYLWAVTVASDSFTNSDGVALTTHNSNFTNIQGTFAINTNALASTAATDNAARYSGASWQDDQWSQGTVAALSGTPWMGVSVRGQSASTGWYGFIFYSSNSEVYRVVGGSYTTIQSGAAPSTSDTMYLEVQGTTLLAKVNTSTFYSGTQTSFSSGQAGVAGYGNNTGTRLDNWSAGDFTSGATVEQEGFRFGYDDANESSHTWRDTQDTNVTAPLAENVLLRVLLNATNNPDSAAYTLRYKKSDEGSYVAVPVGSTAPDTYGAVTFGAIGTGSNGSTSCTPSYPTGISSSTSKLLCMVASGASTEPTPTMPSGWTQIGTLSGGSGATYATDVGNRRVTWFQKDTVTGSESGTETVSLSGGDTMRAHIMRVEVPSGYTLDVQFLSGQDTTHNTSWSVTATSSGTFRTDDLVLVGTVQCVDNATQSSQSLTASGVSFGTRTNRQSTAVTTGADHRYVLDSLPVTSGGGPVAPTWTHTNSSNTSGVTSFLILTARLPGGDNRVYVNTSSYIASGGEDTTYRLDAPSGKTTSDFQTGRRWDDENGTDSLDLSADKYTELEWNLRAQSPATNGDVYQFRVYAGSNPLDTYTVTPQWTIGTPGAGPARRYIINAWNRLEQWYRQATKKRRIARKPSKVEPFTQPRPMLAEFFRRFEPTLLYAQTTRQFCIAPVVGTGTHDDKFRSKYSSLAMLDYPTMKWALILTEDPSVAVQSDTFCAPSDLSTHIGSANATLLTNFLSNTGVPTDFVSASTTYREVLRRVAAVFLYAQRLNGVGATSIIKSGLTLDSRFNQLTSTEQNQWKEAGASLIYPTVDWTNTTTLRTILSQVAQDWGAREIILAGEKL